MTVSRSLLIASLCAAPLALGLASSTLAGPLATAAIPHDATSNSGPRIHLVRDGHGGHFGGGHLGRFGPGVVFGLPYYDYGPAYYDDYYVDDDDDGADLSVDDPVARCQARYRSFDPASGTFLGYDGLRHPCPYLG